MTFDLDHCRRLEFDTCLSTNTALSFKIWACSVPVACCLWKLTLKSMLCNQNRSMYPKDGAEYRKKLQCTDMAP